MTKDQLIYFRTRIETDVENLKQRISGVRRELLQRAEVRPTVIGNGLDHAQAESDLNTRLDLNEQDVRLLSRLRAALRKITIGNYGHCDHCEEFIGMQRLRVQPTATRCFECQVHSERQRQALPIRAKPTDMLMRSPFDREEVIC